MITKGDVIRAAYDNGFADIGFTTAEPFDTHKEFLSSRQEEYGWAQAVGLDLMAGTDPKIVLPTAKTIIVLLEVYFRQAYPASVEGHFGRCYLDDDRVTQDGLSKRIHGNADRAAVDRVIRLQLEARGLTVIEIASSDLNDPAVMELHFKRLALALQH